MAIFHKTKEQQPQLDINHANKILENVFKESNLEPNLVPLEVLTAYSNYRKERFSLQRLLIIIIMVLFFMLPFLFIPSSFSITENTDDTDGKPTYTLKVTSKMLVDHITAVIDGRNIPVYETDSRVYSIEPSINGRMAITVSLINKQTTTKYVEVTAADSETPVLLSTNTDESFVYLYLSDTGSGIDYENITAIGENQETIQPESTDKSTGCVTFPYPNGVMNIYIPDFAGNKLQLVIRIK